MNNRRILIADDHPTTCSGLARLFKLEWPEVEIATANTGVEACKVYDKFKPQVVIIDYSMPDLSGYDASIKILKKDPEARIILFTMFDSLPVVLNFLKIGGRGFLSKGCVEDELLKAIQVVSIGDYYFHSDHYSQIVAYLENGLNENVPKIKFTTLEIEIIVKTSRGLTIKEIADYLNLSPRTVEAYRYSLLKKTKVNNAMELIDYFYRNGIGFNLSIAKDPLAPIILQSQSNTQQMQN